MNKLFAAAAVAALAMAGLAQASELLTNGTFDAGATGFQSGYAYAVTHDLYPEGTYDVISNPQADHNLFSAFADHTPGADTGLMMVINGSGTPNTVVWSEGTVGTPLIGAAGTAFTFSFWLASVYPDRYGDFTRRAMRALNSHIKYSGSTDSSGTANLSGIKPDEYYLFSITRSGKGFALWDSPVSVVPGENVLDLSPQAITEVSDTTGDQ